MDTRHKKRIETVQNIFAYTFLADITTLPYPNDLTQKVIDHITEIDQTIAGLAIKFPINKIAKIDLAILRLAVYELAIAPHEPIKVVINEAIELAKELGGEKSFSFVNGVLGKYIKQNEK